MMDKKILELENVKTLDLSDNLLESIEPEIYRL